jgi:hypothetical protein
VLDVAYDELVRDPAACLARIYGRLGLERGDDLAQRAQRLLAERPKDRFGRHAYAAEDFGTTAAAIRERFAGYHRRHLTRGETTHASRFDQGGVPVARGEQ